MWLSLGVDGAPPFSLFCTFSARGCHHMLFLVVISFCPGASAGLHFVEQSFCYYGVLLRCMCVCVPVRARRASHSSECLHTLLSIVYASLLPLLLYTLYIEAVAFSYAGRYAVQQQQQQKKTCGAILLFFYPSLHAKQVRLHHAVLSEKPTVPQPTECR